MNTSMTAEEHADDAAASPQHGRENNGEEVANSHVRRVSGRCASQAPVHAAPFGGEDGGRGACERYR